MYNTIKYYVDLNDKGNFSWKLGIIYNLRHRQAVLQFNLASSCGSGFEMKLFILSNCHKHSVKNVIWCHWRVFDL